VISKRGLTQLLKGMAKEVVTECANWYKAARAARWESFDAVRADFPDADQTGSVLIFNIRHNRYRLIARVLYTKQKLYVKALLTHKEYDREEWKKWA